MKTYFLFDYIYFRITRVYFKWDGRTGATGIIGVSMIQIFMLIDLFVVTTKLFLSKGQLKSFSDQIILIYIIIALIIIFLNYKKYNGTYNKLKNHWKNESDSLRTIKGLFVILSLIFPFILLAIINYWIPYVVTGREL